jgi:hypothetical protein
VERRDLEKRPFLFIHHISLNSTVIPPLWLYFEQSNMLCEGMLFYGQTESAVKYEIVLWLYACKYLFSQVLAISFDSLWQVNTVQIFTVRELSCDVSSL